MRLRLLLRMGYFLFTLPMELGVRPHKSPVSIVLLFTYIVFFSPLQVKLNVNRLIMPNKKGGPPKCTENMQKVPQRKKKLKKKKNQDTTQHAYPLSLTQVLILILILWCLVRGHLVFLLLVSVRYKTLLE